MKLVREDLNELKWERKDPYKTLEIRSITKEAKIGLLKKKING